MVSSMIEDTISVGKFSEFFVWKIGVMKLVICGPFSLGMVSLESPRCVDSNDMQYTYLRRTS